MVARIIQFHKSDIWWLILMKSVFGGFGWLIGWLDGWVDGLMAKFLTILVSEAISGQEGILEIILMKDERPHGVLAFFESVQNN